MSLKGFHIVFIAISTLLALVCASVALRAWQADGGAPTLFGLALSSASMLALASYGVWFYRQLSRLP